MKKYAKSPADYTIGFRTKRSTANEEAWFFANNKCGIIWCISGIIGALLTIAAVFTPVNDIIQVTLLIAMIADIFIPAVFIENELKKKFDRN